MEKVCCKECKTEVSENDFCNKEYYQEEHPEITVGPYCNKCLAEIRFCDCCQKPYLKEKDINHFGIWVCNDCIKDAVKYQKEKNSETIFVR